MREIIFELCAETLEAALSARAGGAHRIELCSGLSEGGLTASHGMLRAVVEQCGLPVHAMVRPRAGDYVYSNAEVSIMASDIEHAREMGAAGVVLGLLRADGQIDIDRTRALVELARPMQVTFHRAFDEAPAQAPALEAVIAAGCDRILTSGGAHDVLAGSAQLAQLVAAARGRIHIAVGGGLRLDNAAELRRRTGATHFHGSLRNSDTAQGANGHYSVDADDIATIIENLRTA
jgi:copper homeostasis protein